MFNLYHVFATHSSVSPFDPEVPYAVPPSRSSLRRMLDLLLRKPAYLAQFRQLGKTGKASPRLFDLLVIVGRREGVIAAEVSKGKLQMASCPLTTRGRALLTLLGDLAELEHLARMVDSREMDALRRRRFGHAAATAIQRVLRTRGGPRWLERMTADDDGFTAEDLQVAEADTARVEGGGILRLFRTYGLIERLASSRGRVRRYRLTPFGLGAQTFIRRLADLDSVPEGAEPEAVRSPKSVSRQMPSVFPTPIY